MANTSTETTTSNHGCMDDCGTKELANELFTSLSADAPDLPDVDFTTDQFKLDTDAFDELFKDQPEPVTLEGLTTGCVGGKGVFDTLMASFSTHLETQVTANRIDKNQFANVYAQSIGPIMSNATSFILQKDGARWQAIQAQMQARITTIQAKQAEVDLEIAKINATTEIYKMRTTVADYALKKIQLATADAQFCLIKAQSDNEQYRGRFLLPAERSISEYNRMAVLPAQVEASHVQSRRILPADAAAKEFTNQHILPIQAKLVGEQYEAERAKTADTRSDGTLIEGSVGKQKDLYDQQIDTYIKDQQYKTAKMYLDVWVTQRTTDEGLLAPDQLINTEIGAVVENVRQANNLGSSTSVTP